MFSISYIPQVTCFTNSNESVPLVDAEDGRCRFLEKLFAAGCASIFGFAGFLGLRDRGDD
jgi:hypothetical protein